MTAAYALYRRSRAHQDLSIEEQRSEVRIWASAHGYEIVREFADDRSGLDTDRRSGFLGLLTVCAEPRQRAADIVLCYDVSRFSRLEPDEAAFHEHSLRRAGVRVVYTHEPGANEDGLQGQIIKTVRRAMAHDYSQKLSQVVRRGKHAHAELGHWNGGRPPYGYRRAVRDGETLRVLELGRWKAKGETIVLVVEPGEAAAVASIFEAYTARGKGLAAIAAELNARRIPTPTSDRRHGVSAWTKGTVWTILRNTLYRGTMVYLKARYSEIGKKRGKARRPENEWIVLDGAAPPLVTPEVWAAAQAQHGSRKFGTGRPWHRPYLLSGLIVCDHCGKRFIAHKQSRPGRITAYYLCGGYRSSGPAVCDSLRVAVEDLDAVVIEGVQKRLDLILDRDVLHARLVAMLESETPQPEAAADVERELGGVRAKIARLVGVLAGGADDLPSVRAELVRLERERQRLDEQVAGAKTRADQRGNVGEIADALIDALGRFPEVLRAGEPEERKRVIRAFLEGIEIRKVSRQAVLRWYRLPRLDHVALKVVELRGVEPLTPRLPALCSPN